MSMTDEFLKTSFYIGQKGKEIYRPFGLFGSGYYIESDDHEDSILAEWHKFYQKCFLGFIFCFMLGFVGIFLNLSLFDGSFLRSLMVLGGVLSVPLVVLFYMQYKKNAVYLKKMERSSEKYTYLMHFSNMINKLSFKSLALTTGLMMLMLLKQVYIIFQYSNPSYIAIVFFAVIVLLYSTMTFIKFQRGRK